jgi:proline iminopeptidase
VPGTQNIQKPPDHRVIAMKIRTLALLLPLAAAACDDAPTISAGTSAPLATSYDAPKTGEGYLPGAGGVQLFYRVYGSGPDTAVVISGGPGLSLGYLDRDLAPLAHGRTVIFYDSRGAGRSTLLFDPAQMGIQQHVADVEAVRQHFGIGKLSLVGHSWGAMVAPMYAAQYPANVNRLVMVTPGPVQAHYDAQFEAERIARTSAAALQRQGELFGELAGGQSPDPAAACEELLSIWFPAYFHDAGNMANLKGSWCDVPAPAANALLFTMVVGRASLGPDFDLRPMLRTVQAPVLVIHGAADPIPFQSTKTYADEIPGARFSVIQQAGHFPWLEQPTAFFTQVNNFLRRQDVAH